MSVRLNYFGVPGRATYFGRGKNNRDFSLWSKNDDKDHEVFVYVPKFQVDRDDDLQGICKGAIDEDTGFMVTMAHWQTIVTPEGTLRSLEETKAS